MASCCGMKSRIASLFDDASTADVTFVVGEASFVREQGVLLNKVHFHAHAAVVSTASDSLKAMFFGGFSRERVVAIPDASPDGFRALLKYIYTEEADITAENVESVLVLSDKYLLNGLFAASIEWIKRNVTASNALRLLPLTELYSDLAESCWQAVFDHGEEVLNSSEFLSIPKNLLAQMLSSDELIAAEKTVYTRVLNWAKCQLEQHGQHVTPPSLRTVVGDLLYLIRFPLFEADEFDSGPARDGILSDEECHSLCAWFVSKSAPTLFTVCARRPPWVSVEEFMREFGLRRTSRCEHELEPWRSVEIMTGGIGFGRFLRMN